MKRYILNAIFIFIATIQHVYSSEQLESDSVSDQQMQTCLVSDTFQNLSLVYSYEHSNWELRVIFNPQYEQMELGNGQSSPFQFYYGIFSRDRIPESLESHLKGIVENQLKSLSGGHWGFSSTINDTLSIDYFAGATAVPGTGRSQPATQNAVSEEAIQVSPEESSFDREVGEFFKGQTFGKLSLNYPWEGESYPVYFVHNPMREALFCDELSKPVRWPLAMTIDAASYPLSLAAHIKSLVPSELLKDHDTVIDSVYKNVRPILLLNQLENLDVDAEMKALFASDQLAKKSLYYELDGNFYGVFLIHNPERLNLTSTLGFDTWENGRLSHTSTWNSKIGIFVDKEAPQELIDHLAKSYELSYWDSYWNLSIHNGDKVEVRYFKDVWKYKYTPYSWYKFMLNATP